MTTKPEDIDSNANDDKENGHRNGDVPPAHPEQKILRANDTPRSNPPVVFFGRTLPERASTTLDFTRTVASPKTHVEVRIINSQLSAVVRPGEATDIFTLSNIVKKAVLDHLAVYGFVFGDSRDVEIVRVVSPERNIDHVFGTGVQKLFERHSPEGKEKALSAIFPFLNGDDGMYASRALRFLSAAIRTPEETPFFCWQALDSLRMHFAAKNSLETLGESAQWDAFCEYTEVAPETLSAAASEARFRPGPFSEDDRLETFERTWNIVERYFGVSEL